MAGEYHTCSGCLAPVLSERFSMASWERKQIYRFSNKIPFPVSAAGYRILLSPS